MWIRGDMVFWNHKTVTDYSSLVRPLVQIGWLDMLRIQPILKSCQISNDWQRVGEHTCWCMCKLPPKRWWQIRCHFGYYFSFGRDYSWLITNKSSRTMRKSYLDKFSDNWEVGAESKVWTVFKIQQKDHNEKVRYKPICSLSFVSEVTLYCTVLYDAASILDWLTRVSLAYFQFCGFIPIRFYIFLKKVWNSCL